MKTMYLILTMLLLFTGCEKEEAKEEEQQDPSVIALQKIYDNSNGKGDAISITMEDLEATKVTDLIATKLPQYQTSIGAKTDFSNPAKVSELQTLVMNVNNPFNKLCSYVQEINDENTDCLGGFILKFNNFILATLKYSEDLGYYFRFSTSEDNSYYDCVIIGIICDESLIDINTLNTEISLKCNVYQYNGAYNSPVGGTMIYAINNLIFKN